MDFNELLITTGVDALVRLVREKQRIQMSMAAQILNIPESTIEEWAHILEEEGIVQIEYHLTKVFITWVKPSEDTIKKEQESFEREKGTIVKEIQMARGRLEPELTALNDMKDSFSKVYEKLKPRLEALEKQLVASGTASQTVLGKQKEALEKNQEKIRGLEENIAQLKGEIQELKRENSTKELKKSVKETYAEVEALTKEIDAAISRVKKKREEIPAEMPGSAQIREKFEELHGQFDQMRNAHNALQENMRVMYESSGMFTEMEAHVKDYEAKMAKARTELDSLLKTAEDLQEQSRQAYEKLKKDREAFEQFGENIQVAREIVHRFPSQKEMNAELKRIEKVEKTIEEKLDALGELVRAVPEADDLRGEFDEIEERAAAKKAELEERAAQIQETVEEGTSSFKTFEKVREKILFSVKEYGSHVDMLGADIRRIKKENERALADLERAQAEYQSKIKKQEAVDILKAAQEIEDKKGLLEDIAISLESLEQSSEDIQRKLAVLAKEAQLVELRTSTAGAQITSGMVEKEKELIQTVQLTRQEEAEFKRKREELRDLIKKLWEEA